MKYEASIEGHYLKSKTEKKPNDLRSEGQLHSCVLNWANVCSNANRFRTTTPSMLRPRPMFIGRREKGCLQNPIPTRQRLVLSGFRLRLLPPPTQAALSLTELRE